MGGEYTTVVCWQDGNGIAAFHLQSACFDIVKTDDIGVLGL